MLNAASVEMHLRAIYGIGGHVDEQLQINDAMAADTSKPNDFEYLYRAHGRSLAFHKREMETLPEDVQQPDWMPNLASDDRRAYEPEYI